MAVFKMDKNFDVILNPEAVKLVPELSVLSKDELKYVILVADYVDGPYRRKPIEERKLMALRNVYKDSKKKIETPNVKLGLECYKGLVFDIRRETVDVLHTKILKLQKQSLSDVSYSEATQIDKAITFYTNRVESILKSLDLEDINNIQLKAGRRLSRIEIWQRNQKSFNEFKKG